MGKLRQARSFWVRMFLVCDTLRAHLLVLFAWLGLMTLAVVAWSLGLAVRDHLVLRDDLRTAHEADGLIRLSYELRQEDLAVFAALRGARAGVTPDEAAAATDAAFAAVGLRLGGHPAGVHEVALTDLMMFQDGLHGRRAAVRAVLGNLALPRVPVLRRWRSYLDAAGPLLEAINHDLIREAGSTDPVLSRTVALRNFGLSAYGTLIDNRFGIEALLADRRRLAEERRRIVNASAKLDGAAQIAEHQIVAEDVPAVARMGTATDFMLDIYLPVEARLLEALAAGRPDPALVAQWRAASDRAGAEMLEAEAALAARSAEVLAGRSWRGLAAVALWGAALLLAGVLMASAARFTMKRIVAPLEEVRGRMLRLAQGDLTVEIGGGPRLAEIRAMDDALALFKENGLQRARMQAELARLKDRVASANDAITAEFAAAAHVQAAQLPAPCDLPGARFHTFCRRSRGMAGDSYDCVTLPDGRTRLFQIEVTGHGAAAALVSVMSHGAVRSALLAAAPQDSLPAIVARINAGWTEGAPPFTLLLVEIDPHARIARVVQAGHPPLLRLPRGGDVQMVGAGGPPVGALPRADDADCTCPFQPGDRLFLTTDGVAKAADATGAPFGWDRFRDLLDRHGRGDVRSLFSRLEAALRDWRGTGALDGDVTLLVLEAVADRPAD